MTRDVTRTLTFRPARVTNTDEANSMGFVLLAAIFLASAGFLGSTKLAPTKPPATASAPISGSGEGSDKALQASPQSIGPNAPPQ